MAGAAAGPFRCQCYSLPGVNLKTIFSQASWNFNWNFSASLFPLIFLFSFSLEAQFKSGRIEWVKLLNLQCLCNIKMKRNRFLCYGRNLFMWVKFCTWLNLQLNILDSLKMPSATECLLRFLDLCYTHGCMLFFLISVSSTASGPSCWIAPKLGFR